MRTIITFFIATAIAVVAVTLGGCDDDEGTGGGLEVVATTPQVADFARNVVGDRGTVTQILPANADPHDYEPNPSDAEALLDADLIVRSGGDVDEWMDQIVESSGSKAPVLTLMDEVPTIETNGETDPHWWQDPRNAVLAVGAIRERLGEVDPADSAAFRSRARKYTTQLEKLDRSIAACMDRIPAADRQLVTSHDALGYYADRYGIDVIGAAIPALSTQAQASAGETVDLVELIRRTGVRTIYPEAGVSAELEEAIADEAGARVGGELWADTLGPEGSGGETYVGAMESNTSELADGFSGGSVRCDFGP